MDSSTGGKTGKWMTLVQYQTAGRDQSGPCRGAGWYYYANTI